MTGFHVSTLAHSPAQQRVLELLTLSGTQGATTWQISAEARVQNVATWISHLKSNGVEVVCEYQGMSNGSRVYRYWLAVHRRPAEQKGAA